MKGPGDGMNMNLFLLATELFVVLILLAAQIISVATTRKTLLFGVRVPEGAKKTNEAKKITAFYITFSIISAFLFGLLCFLLQTDNVKLMILGILVLPILMIFISSLIYVLSWKKAKALKAEKGWKPEYAVSIDTTAKDVLTSKIKASFGWYLASAVIVVACFIVAVLYLPYAPAQLPTHWGPDGKADGFSPNSISTFLPMLLISFGMIVLMYLSSFIMARAKLQKGGKYGEVTVWQGIRYKGMMIKYLGFLCLLLCAVFGFLMLMTATVIPTPTTSTPFIIGTAALLAAIMLPMFYIMIKAGQSGEKLPVEDERYVENTTRSITTANDDKFWKLGMFYYNKNDPALFVEPRFGSGTDFNYARPLGIILALLFGAIYIGAIISIIVLL